MEADIHAAESLLITDKKMRGIWKEALAPGKYNLNSKAYTLYPVPTSALVVDWSDIDSPNAPHMAAATTPSKDDFKYPYQTDNANEGYRFNRIFVTTKDGFVLGVDVRMVIRIPPEEASFVIARFGTVFNLIQQIVHPLIDASFRNNAGEKNALDFIQSRTALQAEALEKAKESFEKYHVEAQNLLISGIVPQGEQGASLLKTQTDKQIAVQNQAQFQEQTKAQDQRIALQERTARADMQPQVVQAALNIDINKNNAQAAVAKAEGERDATRIVADGNAAAIRRVGEATADAYHAQSDVIGSQGVVALGSIDRLANVKPETIVPRTLVTSTGGDGKDDRSLGHATDRQGLEANRAVSAQEGRRLRLPSEEYGPEHPKSASTCANGNPVASSINSHYRSADPGARGQVSEAQRCGNMTQTIKEIEEDAKGVVAQRFDRVQRRMMTDGEKAEYQKLFVLLRKQENLVDSITDKLDAIEGAVEERADNYLDANFVDFFTSRKTTAKSLKAWLKTYGKVTVICEKDSVYKYAIAKNLVTDDLKRAFNYKFRTSIYNGFINGYNGVE